MTVGLDHAWPSGLVGRSSGWSERRSPEATMLHPPLAARRPVGLAPRWAALRLPIGEDGKADPERAEPSTLSIKVTPRPGLPEGLSSGASSALLRETDGTVIRVKRCGFATLGVGGRAGHVGRVGLMSIAEALQECRMLAAFRRQGLNDAARPISVDILADPSVPFFEDHAYAAVRLVVTSDVRADEWFLRILEDDLASAGLPPPWLRIIDDERISLRNVAEATVALRCGRAMGRVADLGGALGGLLRATHDAGLFRGRGSVWMGNDVIGADGRLSAIDADGGAMSGAGSWAVMKRIEATEYAAGFADCFSWGQPDWLAEPATILAEAFWEGYRAGSEPRIEGGTPLGARLRDVMAGDT
ncbi:MAG: hypothetical protein SFW09_23980 [Hyphomicrobiaceae bacterium]|nr:hypothetical protein [Hyphomicrobiaceae bacterium]